MAGEQTVREKPPTYEELEAKYVAEGAREYGGRPPSGGEREQRFHAAMERANLVFATRLAHAKLQAASQGRSGILSETQLTAIEDWQEANGAVLAINSFTQTLLDRGTAFGFTEGQVVDFEATAVTGLELFETPEARQ